MEGRTATSMQITPNETCVARGKEGRVVIIIIFINSPHTSARVIELFIRGAQLPGGEPAMSPPSPLAGLGAAGTESRKNLNLPINYAVHHDLNFPSRGKFASPRAYLRAGVIGGVSVGCRKFCRDAAAIHAHRNC